MMAEKTVFVITAVLLITITLVQCTEVSQCKNAGKSASDSIKGVSVSNCDQPPCKLKRRTKITIEEKFIPNKDVQSLTTSVHATILGVPLPFIGVDGTDACKFIYNTDGTKTGCPLKQGNEYLYKNEFPILDFYPKVSLVVYWALAEKGEVISCFEVPSKITS